MDLFKKRLRALYDYRFLIKQLVAKDVKLTMTTDAMVFKDNSSKVLTTKTLTSGDLVVPVKCIKASKGARIAITLLNN